MAAATDYSTQAQDQLLSTIRQTQEAVVKAVESWASAVSKLPSVPSVKLPYAEELPSAEDVLETGFSFAQKLLDAQHEFALNLLKAAAPAVAKDEPAAKASKVAAA